MKTIKIKKYCPRCLEPISKEKRDDVDYDYECINCDENFYGFELYVETDAIEINKNKTK
tara:strand:+ start:2158 stop:2334 length:177 start_codon:yes stop_codon:yes gene_type:complete